jgi:hypothetical protein
MVHVLCQPDRQCLSYQLGLISFDRLPTFLVENSSETSGLLPSLPATF